MNMMAVYPTSSPWTIRMLGAIFREAGPMRIAYSPDADVLTIQLREGKLVDSRDIAEGIIVHLSAKG
jgi:hypothetical protein